MTEDVPGIADRNHARLCVVVGVAVRGIPGKCDLAKLSPRNNVANSSPKNGPAGEVQGFTAIGEFTGDAPWNRDFGSGTVLRSRDTDRRDDAAETRTHPLPESPAFVTTPANPAFSLRGNCIPENCAVPAGATPGGT